MADRTNLEARVEALIEDFEGTASVFGRRLDGGGELIVGNVDDPFPTGSAAKVLVLLAYLDAVDFGRLSHETRASWCVRTIETREAGAGCCATSVPDCARRCTTAPR
jgi:beta-lactamase class A